MGLLSSQRRHAHAHQERHQLHPVMRQRKPTERGDRSAHHRQPQHHHHILLQRRWGAGPFGKTELKGAVITTTFYAGAFEDGSLTHAVTGADSVSGGVTLNSAAPLKGAYSADVPNVSAAYLQEEFTGVDDLYVSFYLKLHALPASDARILLIANSGTNVGVLMLRTSGALQLRNNSTLIGSDSAALSVGTLYRVALRQKKGTGSDAILEAYLAMGDDAFGAPFASTNTGTWTTQATNLRLGATAAVAVNATVDNIRLDSGSLPPAGYAPHNKGGLHRDVLAEPNARPKWGGKATGWGGKHFNPPSAPALYTSPPTGQIWKVYYYAGSQMVAMRELSGTTGNTLYYLHSDHLGSTSTTTCGNSACGTLSAVLTRQSYYPYGAVRQAGNLPTDKTFTGQYSDVSTGLQYFNARYFSNSLGRFISADTIVPGAGNPQAFNRYSYSLSNPLNYTDPSGHTPLSQNQYCSYANSEDCGGTEAWVPGLSAFGITTSGLTPLEKLAILAAAQVEGAALLAISPVFGTAAEAFKAVHGLASSMLSFERCPAGECSEIGWTKSENLVWFNPFVYSSASYPNNWWERTVHLVVHELGHVFNARMETLQGALAEKLSPYAQLFKTQANDATFPNRVDYDTELKGFAGHRYNWQQSWSGSYKEEFADMFLGWTYNRWETGIGLAAGQARADWMAARMPLWVNLAGAATGGD